MEEPCFLLLAEVLHDLQDKFVKCVYKLHINLVDIGFTYQETITILFFSKTRP